MQYDYFIYIFILICFIYGMYRGILREISFIIVFSIATFVPLYFYNNIKDIINGFVSIEYLYNMSINVTQYFSMSLGLFEFLIVYMAPFILINLLLNGFIYMIIFKRHSVKRKSLTLKQRFFGGISSIVIGLELSIIMLFILNGIIDLELNCVITNIIVKIPKVNDFLVLVSK